jgi:hypothetical protein
MVRSIGLSLAADNEILECGYFAYDGLPEPIREHLRQRIEDYYHCPNVVIQTQ